MTEYTDREELILQKLIRQEIRGAGELPHLDEEYVNDLKMIYNKMSQDHWEGYDD
jgi:hypothetical protein